MIQAPLLVRSVLYVPGSNPKALAKAPSLGADALILDLEDSVAPGAKIAARSAILEALRQRDAARRPLHTVRINGLASPWWQEDLEAILPGRPDAVVIPKVEDPAEINAVTAVIARHLTDPVPVWPMIESPRGVLQASVLAAQPGVAALVMGTSDLGKELRVHPAPGRPGLQAALQWTILAARAAGAAVVDGVFLDLGDGEGFLSQCREGAILGFDGKSVIHPSQIQPANRTFLPGPEALAQARRILEAWQNASAQGDEICLLDGRLVERLHAQEAERIVALCKIAENE